MHSLKKSFLLYIILLLISFYFTGCKSTEFHALFNDPLNSLLTKDTGFILKTSVKDNNLLKLIFRDGSDNQIKGADYAYISFSINEKHPLDFLNNFNCILLESRKGVFSFSEKINSPLKTIDKYFEKLNIPVDVQILSKNYLCITRKTYNNLSDSKKYMLEKSRANKIKKYLKSADRKNLCRFYVINTENLKRVKINFFNFFSSFISSITDVYGAVNIKKSNAIINLSLETDSSLTLASINKALSSDIIKSNIQSLKDADIQTKDNVITINNITLPLDLILKKK